MGAKFKMMLSGEALTSAVKDVFTKSGGDPAKIGEGLNSIREKWNAMFSDPTAMANLRQIRGLLNDFYNDADQASAKWTGNESTRLDRLKAQMEDLGNGASSAVNALAQLQVDLIGAGSTERNFGSQVEGLLRGGNGFGFTERLSAATRGLEIAKQLGLEQSRSASILKEIALEEHKILELGKQRATLDFESGGVAATADAAKTINAELSSVKNDVYADIASSLDQAQDAALAIKEALGGLNGAPLIPSQINVNGGGGTAPITITRGAITVQVTGQANSQQTIDEVEQRLRAEFEADMEQIRAAMDAR